MARRPRQGSGPGGLGPLASQDQIDPTPPPSETGDVPTILGAEAQDRADDAKNAAENGVTYTEDGGAVIDLDHDKEVETDNGKHFQNLVEVDSLKAKIELLALNTHEDIGRDIESGKNADARYARAIEDSGFTGKAPGGASFPGASTVTMPLVGEVCSDFTSRVLRELLPPKGPAKPHVEGAVTKEKYDRAKRVARWANWMTRRQMENFADEVEQTMAQLPFSGSAYMKLWKEGKRARVAFISSDKVHRPPSDDNFYDCERITHELTVSERQLEQRMRSGLYADIDLGSPSTEPERNKVEAAADKTTGVQPTGENVDNSRTLYETSLFWDGEGDMRPYILTMDKDTQRPLALYRNWEKKDESRKRLDFLYEFGFMPFRGGKPIGIPHLLAGIPRAATGAARAVLDSAHANNNAGGVKLKSGQSGQNVRSEVGVFTEIENATQTDDIRKVVMQSTFHAPSEVLFKMLGFLIDAAKGVVRTNFDDIVGKGRQDIPVGTMMMLVDEGTVVYSSIFARQHRTMGRLLAGLFRLGRQIVDNVSFADTDGDTEVTKFDFEGDSVVAPVSDPRINSDTQRWTRANFLGERAKLNPLAYNAYEVEKTILEAGQFDNIDKLLVKPPTPTEMPAVNENVAIALGRPVTAFPEQNHPAHVEVHADWVKSPLFGLQSPSGPQMAGPMLQHLREHMAMDYAATVLAIVDEKLEAVVGTDEKLLALFVSAHTIEGKATVVEMLRLKEPELGRKIDLMFAATSGIAVERISERYQKLMPLLGQMQQMAAKVQPPMPMDPAQAAIATANIAAQTQAGIAQGRQATEQRKIEQQAQESAEDRAVKVAIETRKADQDDRQHVADIAQRADETDIRHQMNREDNATALTIADAELRSGEKIGVSTGTGINPR
jgi:hypothetical protein